jgi:CMP-N,N'-diacetyllegionaminic acid synthase
LLCYALRRDPFLADAPILNEDCAAVVVERQVVNIDEPFELELAAWLLERQDRVTSVVPFGETA